MKNTRSADFCADRIDVIMNFDVITNVVIKRAHCIHLKPRYKEKNKKECTIWSYTTVTFA